jgi:hypothetical protein
MYKKTLFFGHKGQGTITQAGRGLLNPAEWMPVILASFTSLS